MANKPDRCARCRVRDVTVIVKTPGGFHRLCDDHYPDLLPIAVNVTRLPEKPDMNYVTSGRVTR